MADGECHAVECAVCADGSSPVADFLEALASDAWAEAEAADVEADGQVQTRYLIISAWEHFAETREFAGPIAHNQLMNGVWEIKRRELRISFYDTDGMGNCSPKIVKDRESFWAPPGLPDFDEYIRLGTVFVKASQKTPTEEIKLSQTVRLEDLEHDKAA